ncbi:hypothetical protein PPL_10903 [Heterostelium album PN500]|uniref:AraC effector-binding domain-containing protein n=1 Tax=Heterostelium pallidum (strain ATCC 26659 / Pp 5 / PN500) TaxID=670386 RepID=D3BSD6_HETP5|nr:hypothetical protein PPL_10903 [Heterostelium album PN500]EFA75642.1 hypothetical protein PPL_10903 [Heterostelium album PN500]|eukprot:XP_020427776.1 hypothetical protein PPL_10903 [Heterostelium album PN500]
MSEIEIQFVKSRDSIGIHGVGPYDTTFKRTVCDMFKFIEEKNVVYEKFIGYFYDNPCEVAPDQCRSVASILITKEQLAALNLSGQEQVKHIVWEEGEYAVMLYKGPYENLNRQYQTIFEEIVKINRIPSEYPSVEVYLNDCGVTPPSELLTQIYVKLEPISK